MVVVGFHSNSGVLFRVFLANLSPTSFCAKRASSRLGRTYFYGWLRPQSFPSTSWYWQCACCPPCRPFTGDSGAVHRPTDWVSASWLDFKLLKLFLLFYSGEPLKTSHRLEDGHIGGQPEVIYHVFHTLLFGGLTLLFDGCVNISASFSEVFHNGSLWAWWVGCTNGTAKNDRLITVKFLCSSPQKISLLPFLQDKISVDSLHLHVHSFWCVFSRSLDDCV